MIQIAPHPELHPIFEGIGYLAAFALYFRERRSFGDILSKEQRWALIAAAMLGALAGSRLLGLIEVNPVRELTLARLFTPGGGKTVVGGLLGGWLGVEIAKKLKQIPSRTGDLFAIPLCVGIAVGRIGCLLAGLADDTYGTPTSLPWSVNFGDGVGRHPTQAYEIVFLTILATTLHYARRMPHKDGTLFRLFMAAYLSWRLLIDFLKPAPVISGLSVIQWACAIGLVLVIAGWRGSSAHSTEEYA